MIDVAKAIANAVKTGKVVFGANEAIKSAKTGKARLIIVASSSPVSVRKDLEYYGKLSRTPIVAYKGSSADLGANCGKQFPIATLTIKEPGDSDILKLAEKPAEENIEEL
ncbi:MAG: 50S ribosomal protein L30e [Candidatus Bathyarchaeia archaeon]